MAWFSRFSERAELDRLLQGKHQFRVSTSKSQVAASLWDYGEDDLAARAIDMSGAELHSTENISAWYEDPNTPFP